MSINIPTHRQPPVAPRTRPRGNAVIWPLPSPVNTPSPTPHSSHPPASLKPERKTQSSRPVALHRAPTILMRSDLRVDRLFGHAALSDLELASWGTNTGVAACGGGTDEPAALDWRSRRFFLLGFFVLTGFFFLTKRHRGEPIGGRRPPRPRLPNTISRPRRRGRSAPATRRTPRSRGRPRSRRWRPVPAIRRSDY